MTRRPLLICASLLFAFSVFADCEAQLFESYRRELFYYHHPKLHAQVVEARLDYAKLLATPNFFMRIIGGPKQSLEARQLLAVQKLLGVQELEEKIPLEIKKALWRKTANQRELVGFLADIDADLEKVQGFAFRALQATSFQDLRAFRSNLLRMGHVSSPLYSAFVGQRLAPIAESFLSSSWYADVETRTIFFATVVSLLENYEVAASEMHLFLGEHKHEVMSPIFTLTSTQDILLEMDKPLSLAAGITGIALHQELLEMTYALNVLLRAFTDNLQLSEAAVEDVSLQRDSFLGALKRKEKYVVFKALNNRYWRGLRLHISDFELRKVYEDLPWTPAEKVKVGALLVRFLIREIQNK
jgi:hypothetical protein